MKKLAFLLTLVLLLALLGACFTDPDAPASPSQSASPSPSASAPPSPNESANATGEPTGDPDPSDSAEGEPDTTVVLPEYDVAGKTARVMSWWSQEDGTGNVEKFEDLYGAHIQFDQVAWNQMADQLASEVMSGIPPDVVMMNTFGTYVYPARGFLQPLEDQIDFDSNLWKPVKDFNLQLKFEGSLYTIVTATTVGYYVWYNKDKFEAFGLEDPLDLYDRGEWTYAKLLEYAIELTDTADGAGKYGITAPYYLLGECVLASLKTDLVTIGSDGLFAHNLDDPKLALSVETVYDLYNRYNVVHPSVNYSQTFARGNAAMLLEGLWLANSEPMASMLKNGTIGCVMWPRWDEGSDDSQWAIFNGLGVPKGAKDLDLSMAVISSFRYGYPRGSEQWTASREKTYAAGWTERDLEHRTIAGRAIFPSKYRLIPDAFYNNAIVMYTGGESFAEQRAMREPLMQKALDEFNAMMRGEEWNLD